LVVATPVRDNTGTAADVYVCDRLTALQHDIYPAARADCGAWMSTSAFCC